MMIIAECYYESNLRGKSQSEILREIRTLKRKITNLKRVLEGNILDPDPVISPSPLTRLKCSREYLEMAKRAYREAGGEYIPTQAERRDRAFNDGLLHLQQFVFEYGGFFSGHVRLTYTVVGDEVRFDIEHFPDLKLSNTRAGAQFTREEFIRGIAELHIGEWKREYIDKGVLDGTQWSVQIEYDDDRKPVQIDGSNAYPYNFDDLRDFLEDFDGHRFE